jgi:hypothetical protein
MVDDGKLAGKIMAGSIGYVQLMVLFGLLCG